MNLVHIHRDLWVNPESVDAVFMYRDITYSQVRILVAGKEFDASEETSRGLEDGNLSEVLHRLTKAES